ncbi:iron-sulfur cluster co-chaperone protein HscB-like [Lineus longissimus]|uniref:iron-sulfur cluster co-chaperone protein HscB-like n=1 Tax=Lineus longissimus TaxID=88925 RepID=UPI00315D56F0
MAAPMKKMARRANLVFSSLLKVKCGLDRECMCSTRARLKTVRTSLHRNFSYAHASSSSFVNVSILERNLSLHPTNTIGNCYATLADRNCWNCGRKNGFEDERFFCKCGIIQEVPDDITYFNILGVEMTFDLDLARLRKNFMQYQMKLHPDKFSQKSQEEKQLADDQSAMVNNAYFTLLKPLSRGLYLLEQNGQTLEEGTVKMNNEFLLEIMELNEQIAEATNKETVIQLGKDNNSMLQKMEKKLSEAFKADNISLAKEILQEMKYYDNLDIKIKDLQREQGIVF